MSKKRIYVVSSTHWDREWYEPFQEYRARLVRMMDEVLDILETVPDYRCFHLDGQTIVLYDYLRIRPENRERILKLVREKKLLIGPWYVMPDEFLVSGESLMRNLERGHEICREFGAEPCREGYICDIFGHNSQMPQIFAHFGIDNAELFRGRKGYEKDNFLWQGADGTQAIVHKLHPDYAYSSFFFVERWPFEERPASDEDLVEKMKAYLAREEKHFATDCHLMMDGVDHIDPERNLPHILKVLNENIEGYEFIHSNFEDYTAEIRKRTKDLEKAEGCLYELAKEGINNSLLKNVLSSMVHLKQDNAYLEHHLTLQAEPMEVFLNRACDSSVLKQTFYPHGGFLKEAWDLLLQNQPHDSICGCSITETHADNENRFKQAKEILGTVRNDQMRILSASVTAEGRGKDGALLLVNSSQADVNGVTEVEFSIAEGTHQFRFAFYDESGNEVPFHMVSHRKEILHKAPFKTLIQFEGRDVFTLSMKLQLPAYSYTTLTYDILRQIPGNDKREWGFERFDVFDRKTGSMRMAHNEVDNGVLLVTFCDNGTLKVCNKATGKVYRNLLTLEDCGDAGEGWNYVKPMFDREILSSGQPAKVEVLNDFPDYFRARITVRLDVPVRGEGLTRSEATEPTEVSSEVTLTAGSPLITVKTTVDNRQTDHRLRVLMPTELRTDTFRTQLPFDFYAWKIAEEKTDDYKETETHVNPNQGAVSLTDGKDMFSVYNRGLYEVSVLDRADTPVYLTLFRSFSNETARPQGDMGKMLRKMTFDYQMDFGMRSSSEAVKCANAFHVPLLTAQTAQGKKALPPSGSLLSITGEAVLSEFRAVDGVYEIRIYDVGNGCKGEISVPQGAAKAWEVNGTGEVIGEVGVVAGKIPYVLSKREIKTYRFE